MKKLFLLLFAMLGLLACTQQQKDIEETDTATVEEVRPADGMFIHVTSNDPHRVLMALNMAVLMSDDHDVIMYFDIEGVKVLVKDAPDLTYAGFPGSYEQIRKLTGKGVVIQACPACLKAAGYTPDDLMAGVVIADKQRFFDFTKGRILTLDY